MISRAFVAAMPVFALLLVSPSLLLAQAPPADPSAPQPKRLTLNLKNTPVREAFARIRDQTGIQFSLTATPTLGDETAVTLDVHDQPLWEVVRTLAQQASPAGPLHWYVADPQVAGAHLIGGSISISGPFLIAIRSVTHRIDYSLPDDQVDTLQLEAQVFTDGSLRIPSLLRQVTPTRALDDKGNSLLLSSGPEDQRTFPVSPMASALAPVPFLIALQAPPGANSAARKIATLEGTLPISLMITHNMEFSVPSAGDQQFGGCTFSAQYSDVPAAGAPASRVPRGNVAPGPTVTLTITRDPTAITPDLLTTLRSVQVRLLDASGNPFRNSNSSFQNNGTVRVGTFRFTAGGPGRAQANPSGPPAKITVQIPASNQDITLPYHFENIPFP